MHVTVGAVDVRTLGSVSGGESSPTVRARVEAAREVQRTRFATLRRVSCNAHVAGRWLDARTPILPGARELLTTASERLGLSARGYHRVLKVARTIADLDEAPTISEGQVAEALRYRPASMNNGAETSMHPPRPPSAGAPPDFADSSPDDQRPFHAWDATR
jgi:magnesium chelatase family protein